MPRNNRKKFRKFLEARHHRQKRGGAVSPFFWFDVFCAVLTPFLLGGIVGVLWLMHLCFILYPFLFVIAYVVLLVWGILAFRGASRFWSVKADMLFGAVFVVLVGLGGCWGLEGAVPAKVWITSPAYARAPSLQLDSPSDGKAYPVLEGSAIHLSWQSEGPPPMSLLGDQKEKLGVSMGGDVATTLIIPTTGKATTTQLVLSRGWRKLASWRLHVIPDESPQVILLEEPEVTLRKTIKFVYKSIDDYGIESISVRIAPTSSATGGTTEPVEIALATPTIKEIRSASYIDLTSLPWAGGPVTVQLVVVDGAGHRGWSEPKVITLPSRAFHNPFARALIEERQKYMDNPDASTRDETANVMAGIARQQGLYRGDPVVLMSLRAGAVRLVLNDDPETTKVVADILWKAAVRLEEGVIGQARADLAEAERDLSFSLMRESSNESIQPFLFRVHETMGKYFEALESERARQPPALQEIDWPLATEREMLSPEDLQSRLTAIADNLSAGDRAAARQGLSTLQALIENLRTTPPELTPDQAQMAQRVFALRAIIRGQKNLIEEIEKTVLQNAASFETKKRKRDAAAHGLAQQQLLLSALRDVITRQGVGLKETKAGEDAMHNAILALQKQAISDAQKSQAEALTFLENSLQSLTEQMRRAMTARAP
ncbi:MAG: DUF4175 family protein [Alphaproteobacteria bacterium]|nr:DUF4175 family protein [Alphaproteobacteria bacterium]